MISIQPNEENFTSQLTKSLNKTNP